MSAAPSVRPGLCARRSFLCSVSSCTVFSLAVSTLSLSPFANDAGAAELESPTSTRETIARVAANLPGYGEPDIYYPAQFLGSWRCSRTLTALTFPASVDSGSSGFSAHQWLADMDASCAAMYREMEATLNRSIEYRTRFFQRDGHVILDRAFDAYERSRAEQPFSGRTVVEARWNPNNPNILAIECIDGTIRELKVTKRATEDSGSPDAFGFSEYYRVADTTTGKIMSGVPQLVGLRVQARYRKMKEGAIEGLELRRVYPAVSYTSNPKPAFTAKTRIILERAVS